MTNNFEILRQFIANRCNDFDNDEDKYYVIELIKRNKDHVSMRGNNTHFKNYYINKLSDIDKYKEEIITLCDTLGMRAYMSINYKSYERVMCNTMAEYARRVASHEFAKPYTIYKSCSRKYFNTHDKLWFIDVDEEDADEKNMSVFQLATQYKRIISDFCKPYNTQFDLIPTRTGLHLITKPFDVSAFNVALKSIGMPEHNEHTNPIIKKNHTTLVYENL